MKMRTFKTKRETLPVLILKSFLAASLICGVFAYVRWNVLKRNVYDQFERGSDMNYEAMANTLDSGKGYGDLLPEFINEMTRGTYTPTITVFDLYFPSIDEILSDILGFSSIDSTERSISAGSILGTPGCHSVSVLTDMEGNIIAENTEKLFLYINLNEDDGQLLSFAENTSDSLEAARLYRNIKNSYSEHGRLDLELESVYVNWKTLEFIPCKGRLKTEEALDEGILSEYEQVSDREFSIYIDDKNFELIGVNSPTGNYPKYYHLWFCGEKQEFIDRVLECFDKKQFGRIVDTEKFNKLREETELYNNRFCYIYLNGERYTVYTLNFLNYKTPEFMKMFYNNVFSFSIIVLIIAALFCWWKNTRNKARYAMEDYRKDVTDHLAHDLKTPLMAIGGYAENILDGKLTDEEQKEYLEAIIENVEFADSTMSRTLMLNSMDGNAGFKYETTDVGKVVSEAVKKYEPLLEQNNINFSLEGGATVKVESTSFEKIVENLISNAVKYTPESGSIKVMIDKNKMVISNTVNGKIDTRKLKEPFVRGEESRSNLGGSGLGLSIAERAAALNGFRLNISCTDNEFKAEVKF